MRHLDLTRQQILHFRRRAGALDRRLRPGRQSLRKAAWAGLQDSMPRAALLSLHARVDATTPTALDDPALIQLWGPRYSVFVVTAVDRAVFTLGRIPTTGARRQLAEDLAARLESLLDEGEMPFGDAGRALGEPPNRLRYAAVTGRILLRWDGARQPLIRVAPPPDADPAEARLELVRRYLHVYGPSTPEAFVRWAGVDKRQENAAFEALGKELTPVRTPTGDGSILAEDEDDLLAVPEQPAPARLLPSGDTYYLVHGDDRTLLVPDAAQRDSLWTSRVWPGAVLVDGDIVGVWRRAQNKLTIQSWRRLSRAARKAVEAEAASLPLPGVEEIAVHWDG